MFLSQAIKLWPKYGQVVWWLILMVGFLLVNDTSGLLAIIILSVYTFFLFGFDLIQSVFLSVMLSIPFRMLLVGTRLVAVESQSLNFIRGYGYSFGLDTTLILLSLCFLLLLFTVHRHHYLIKKIPLANLLIGMLGFGLVSSIFAPRLDLAVTGLVSLFVVIGVYLLGVTFFNKKSVAKQLPYFSLGLLLLLGIIGTTQLFLRHSLGLYIEAKSTLSSFEFFTTDGIPLYRVTGIMPHPTFFASTLSLLIPIAVGYLIEVWEKRDKFLILISALTLLLGLISLLSTFSRSGWLAMAIVSFWFFIALTKRRLAVWKKMVKPILGVMIVGFSALIATSFLLPNVFLRIQSLNSVWSLGNWSGRAELIRHSWKMMLTHPFLGVGSNHFTPAMVDQGIGNGFGGFIFPVHNTFLLFLSEFGIPAGLLFIIFVYFVMRFSWKIKDKNWINLGVWLGLLSFIINAQFHTLFNQEPSLNLFMLLSAYLMVQHVSKKRSHTSSSFL